MKGRAHSERPASQTFFAFCELPAASAAQRTATACSEASLHAPETLKMSNNQAPRPKKIGFIKGHLSHRQAHLPAAPPRI